MGTPGDKAAPLSQTTTRGRVRPRQNPALVQVRRGLIPARGSVATSEVSGAGVLFARPLVGSRCTAGQGPLAQKTPTPLTRLPRASRGAPMSSPPHPDSLGVTQFAGRQAKVTCVIRSPSVSKVQVVSFTKWPGERGRPLR